MSSLSRGLRNKLSFSNNLVLNFIRNGLISPSACNREGFYEDRINWRYKNSSIENIYHSPLSNLRNSDTSDLLYLSRFLPFRFVGRNYFNCGLLQTRHFVSSPRLYDTPDDPKKIFDKREKKASYVVANKKELTGIDKELYEDLKEIFSDDGDIPLVDGIRPVDRQHIMGGRGREGRGRGREGRGILSASRKSPSGEWAAHQKDRSLHADIPEKRGIVEEKKGVEKTHKDKSAGILGSGAANFQGPKDRFWEEVENGDELEGVEEGEEEVEEDDEDLEGLAILNDQLYDTEEMEGEEEDEEEESATPNNGMLSDVAMHAVTFHDLDEDEKPGKDMSEMYHYRPGRMYFPGQTYETQEVDLSEAPSSETTIAVTRQKAEISPKIALKKADFRNVRFLVQFISETGKILPRYKTKLSAKAQRKVSREIRLSRVMGLLPFTHLGKPPFRFEQKTTHESYASPQNPALWNRPY